MVVRVKPSQEYDPRNESRFRDSFYAALNTRVVAAPASTTPNPTPSPTARYATVTTITDTTIYIGANRTGGWFLTSFNRATGETLRFTNTQFPAFATLEAYIAAQ